MRIHDDVRDITTQMYLKQIFVQVAERRSATLAGLAQSLGVAAPSAFAVIRRLEEGGLVERGAEGTILLTPTGEAQARTILRRHHLAERLLTATLKLSWAAAHEEACRLEHAISAQVEAALAEMLGHPETCPHGNQVDPLASEPGLGAVALAQLPAGATVTVARIGELGEQEPGLLELLAQYAIEPGTRVTIVRQLPAVDTIELETHGRRVGFGRTMASHVYCQPE